MKYHNFLTGNFFNIFNNSNQNIKIAFTSLQLIITLFAIMTINNKINHINFFNYDNCGVYKLI